MYNINKPLLSVTVLTIGMLSSAIVFANTPSISVDVPAEQQQEEEMSSNIASFSVSNQNPAQAITESLTESQAPTYTTSSSSSPVSSSSSTGSVQNNEVKATEYPSFASEEMVDGYYTYEDTSASNDTTDGDQGSEESTLEYNTETALLYQHLPENPVYTYGKDGQEQGACVGTEEFCQKSEVIWNNFEQRAQAGELIVEADGEDKGQIVMPETFEQNASTQPYVQNQQADCPEGYEYHSKGNQYNSAAHCGKMEGQSYYVNYPGN